MSLETTRRQCLLGSLGLAAWADVAAAWQHAREAVNAPPPRLEVLDPNVAKEVEAIAAQIIPSGEGPGAREAGVIYFIDRALGSFDADKKVTYRKGMDEIQQVRRKISRSPRVSPRWRAGSKPS